MAAIGRRDTKQEMALRSALHRRGHRYRVDLRLVMGGKTVRPDLVFPRKHIAVFMDGCFWHGCAEHGRRPAIKNRTYWGPKIEGNIARDRRADDLLRSEGWTVVRVWEHEPVAGGVAAVEEAISLANALIDQAGGDDHHGVSSRSSAALDGADAADRRRTSVIDGEHGRRHA